MGESLQHDGEDRERELLGQFSQAFAEFRRVDDDVSSLAVMNTNLKAYALAYGPAAAALKHTTDALARLAAGNDAEVTRVALGAEIAALRLQTMLPPHIAEESDERMDQIEAAMAKEEEEVRRELDDLRARSELRAGADLETATSSRARFVDLKVQILKLSRENTNVRSLTISLDRKRKVMLACQEALDALRQAIDAEPIRGLTYGVPVKPR